MKSKILTLVMALCFFLVSGIAFAGGPAVGFLDVDAKALGGGLDINAKHIPNGGAFGVGGAVGGAGADAAGMVFNGEVEGEVETVGGGFTDTNAYKFNVDADKSIGVGSYTSTTATTSASAKIKVNPGKYGFGIAGADIDGFAAMGSLNVSGLGPSPLRDWDSKGHTGGMAGQFAMGGFGGGAFAMSFGDFCRLDSKAGAGVGAGIDMWGGSYSESYRYIDYENGYKTEGMGTNVGAAANVASYGYDYGWGKGMSGSGAYVDGGYMAAGGAATCTVQGNNNGFAAASAIGYYSGSGQLGSAYNGSATGYSGTSVTTVSGMNGTVVSASAGMSVASQVSSGHGQPQ